MNQPKIYAQLRAVQAELKAPKNQYNSFGKYYYRNAEDILEAAKPLLAANGLTLVISDEIIVLGQPLAVAEGSMQKVRGLRFYVKATAKLFNDEGEVIENSAYAREEDLKKGMDESQITGAASSYARKYCLNGLFNIDDVKDADSNGYTPRGNGQQPQQQPQANTQMPPQVVNAIAQIKLCTDVAGLQATFDSFDPALQNNPFVIEAANMRAAQFPPQG